MFNDRADAGRKLCPKLNKFFNHKEVVVVGLMRGGVVTANTIAKTLRLTLKAIIVKKIPHPTNSELAIGAMVTLKDIFLNENLIKTLDIPDLKVNQLILEKWKEIQLTSKKLMLNNKGYKGKTVIVVDDGVATGASVIAAAEFLRRQGASKIILATPVIASDTYQFIQKNFNQIIFIFKKISFYAVGQFYRNFEQISDEQVLSILQQATSN